MRFARDMRFALATAAVAVSLIAGMTVLVTGFSKRVDTPLPDGPRAHSTSVAVRPPVTSSKWLTPSASAPPTLQVFAYSTPPTVTGMFVMSCRARGALPDPTCTPGSVSPVAKATVCVVGFSAKVRPSSRITDRTKTAAMRAYGIPAERRTATELDHLVPLSLGGSNDVTNLWPEVSDIPGGGFRNTKDAVEDRVHEAVCRPGSTVPLDAAQRAFARDWTAALAALGIK